MSNMKYVVIRPFVDLKDGMYRYHVGDTFPRDGMTVGKRRIAQLKSAKNKLKEPVIKSADETEGKNK